MKVASPSDLTRQGAAQTRARDPRARRSMEALHAAILELIEERAFDEITVDDIVEKAVVGKSTFYRHYATKEDLIDAIAKSEIDALVGLTFPLLNQTESFSTSLALAGYVHEKRNLWAALLTGGAASVMRDAFVKQSMTRGVSSVDLPKTPIPVDLAAAFGVTAVFEILSWWLKQPAPPPPVEDVAEYLDRLTVRSIFDPNL